MYSPRGIETLPTYALTPELTPGGYMKSCRERAGVTIEQCAAAIAVQAQDRCHARNEIQLLEDDQPGDYYRLVRALKDGRAFAFDLSTFIALATATAAPEFDPWAEV